MCVPEELHHCSDVVCSMYMNVSFLSEVHNIWKEWRPVAVHVICIEIQ
jgi:hypothetical protein